MDGLIADQPLTGYRVLDFGRFIAGPYCGALLADFGADVIRIDRIEGSEDRYIVPLAASGEGAMFMQMNRGKRSLTLDPQTPKGREIVRQLVRTADVVIANLPPDTLHKMGLDYESLKAVKSDIILTTVSAYGHGGPYSNRVGFDTIGQVMSGGAYMTGTPEQPYRAAVPYVDFGTALGTAFGTLAALMNRQKTGRGQQVEGALLLTALTMSNSMLMEQAVNAPNRIPTGSRSQTSGPSDIFKCADGHIMVSVNGNPMFRRWAKLVGVDEWIEDPRFTTDEARGNNNHIISDYMNGWCANRTVERALAELAEARVPSAQVYTPQQALDDPHIQEMGFLHPVDFPGMPKPAPVVSPQVRLTDTPASWRSRAPMLGEHTEQILGELGYDAEQVEQLRREKVV